MSTNFITRMCLMACNGVLRTFCSGLGRKNRAKIFHASHIKSCHGFSPRTLHKTCLHYFVAPLIFCGGNKEGQQNVIFPRAMWSWAPPHPHTPMPTRGRGTHRTLLTDPNFDFAPYPSRSSGFYAV